MAEGEAILQFAYIVRKKASVDSSMKRNWTNLFGDLMRIQTCSRETYCRSRQFSGEGSTGVTGSGF